MPDWFRFVSIGTVVRKSFPASENRHLTHLSNADGTGLLAKSLIAGDRASLARAITLIESRKAEHQKLARGLLSSLASQCGKSHRIGITGVPGAGKSTLIGQLGVYLTALGHKVAVLAVDPSSARSGGSILGDKTRMAQLSQEENAFIRPSPAGGTLGGVTRVTRETVLLCEAAGFDVILIETVGVGQSEAAVAAMTDFFLVLMLAGAGDELQGIKKGVLELADLIAITKADGDNVYRAQSAAADYRAALHILTPPSAVWKPGVIVVSAFENKGLDGLWQTMLDHKHIFEANGGFDAKRRDQDVRWMYAMVEDELRSAVFEKPSVQARLAGLEAEVKEGKMPPSVAAAEILAMAGLQS
jgi:LAO/AO transport system kinase